jgi:hypothetical protein
MQSIIHGLWSNKVRNWGFSKLISRIIYEDFKFKKNVLKEDNSDQKSVLNIKINSIENK